MRACEGCRKPCVRLKLHCIPPKVNYEREFQLDQSNEPEKSNDNDVSSVSGDEEFHQHTLPQHYVTAGLPNQIPYNSGGVDMYQPPSPYGEPPNGPTSFRDIHIPVHGHAASMPEVIPYPSSVIYSTPPAHPPNTSGSPETWKSESTAAETFDNALGELKIDTAGTAPYISKKTLAAAPAVEDIDEYSHNLPTLTSANGIICIPPELMPTEQQALQYFDIFFTHIHPYVPVINKSYFYQQWQTDRDSISPLVLEAIFACAGNMSDDRSQGARWLAIAGKHESSFMDVTRLSTIQALLLLLKAREAVPKRGYYYRSWMSVVTLVAMAKDMGLHEHYALHQDGKSCDSAYHECITKTRVWQTIFVCELLVGAPQGRMDLSVDPLSVDTNVAVDISDLDQTEINITLNFSAFVKTIRGVRSLVTTYYKMKKRSDIKDWGVVPEFLELDNYFETWLTDLPAELQVQYPADGSTPWIPSHYVGNIHSYYELSIIMLHRPQIATIQESFSSNGDWRRHMLLCHRSAKRLCRLQEAIIAGYGLSGLSCMQRGISFAIYCVLTCTVLHLVAITSPDPELNTDAKNYFTRHMRILEQCTTIWPMPELQSQIDAIREAFSADVAKPFVLKPSFPYNSPSIAFHPSPEITLPYDHQQLSRHSSMEAGSHCSYDGNSISPPIANIELDVKGDTPAVQSLVMMATGQGQSLVQNHSIPQPIPQMMAQSMPQSAPHTLPMDDPLTWNPTRIFNQWASAFGAGPSLYPVSPGVAMAPVPHNASQINALEKPPSQVTSQQTSQAQVVYSSASAPAPATLPTFVSPTMWQDSVASVYEEGLKRRWEFDPAVIIGPVVKRVR
ncbi:MAG: hypothetical protein M1829_001080 [Trizodia sp. TS-e1964]|nr:MAG: hypothetical protein M1829_001080 [Trizodia sp. TS-e1964]